jgi:hypothetical protein
MPFISEQVERKIIKQFANSLGLNPNEVEVHIRDDPSSPMIHMKGHRELKDGLLDAELTITQEDRDSFIFQGSINYQGKAPRRIEIHHKVKGRAELLDVAVRKLLGQTKIKKRGIFSGYFG